MARTLRVEFDNAIYHTCARGNAGQRIFFDERDRACFVELLNASARRFDGAVLCFVLMSNHFHLVAQTHRAQSRALDAVAAGFLHGVLQPETSLERPPFSGALQKFSGARGRLSIGFEPLRAS
jgi:hypothetical protein